jgi:hypothetical protein
MSVIKPRDFGPCSLGNNEHGDYSSPFPRFHENLELP